MAKYCPNLPDEKKLFQQLFTGAPYETKVSGQGQVESRQIFEFIVKKILISNPFARLFKNLQTNLAVGYIFPSEYDRLLTILNYQEEEFCKFVYKVLKSGTFKEKSTGANRTLKSGRDWADAIGEALDIIAKTEDQIGGPLAYAISSEGIKSKEQYCAEGYPKKGECLSPCEKNFLGQCRYKKLDSTKAPSCSYQNYSRPVRL